MTMRTLALALIASVALTAPAEAAAKKRKKELQRPPAGAVHFYSNARPHDVYISGEYIGRDPDPNIRQFMMRNPRIYDGPE
jgi:hypothetical protein